MSEKINPTDDPIGAFNQTIDIATRLPSALDALIAFLKDNNLVGLFPTEEIEVNAWDTAYVTKNSRGLLIVEKRTTSQHPSTIFGNPNHKSTATSADYLLTGKLFSSRISLDATITKSTVRDLNPDLKKRTPLSEYASPSVFLRGSESQDPIYKFLMNDTSLRI